MRINENTPLKTLYNHNLFVNKKVLLSDKKDRNCRQRVKAIFIMIASLLLLSALAAVANSQSSQIDLSLNVGLGNGNNNDNNGENEFLHGGSHGNGKSAPKSELMPMMPVGHPASPNKTRSPEITGSGSGDGLGKLMNPL